MEARVGGLAAVVAHDPQPALGHEQALRAGRAGGLVVAGRAEPLVGVLVVGGVEQVGLVQLDRLLAGRLHDDVARGLQHITRSPGRPMTRLM